MLKYDVISIFQHGGRGHSIQLPVSHVDVTAFRKSKSTSAPNFVDISVRG